MSLQMKIIKESRQFNFKVYTCDTNIGTFIALKREDNTLSIKYTGKLIYKRKIERFDYNQNTNKWETTLYENERTAEVFEEFIKRFYYRNNSLQLSMF